MEWQVVFYQNEHGSEPVKDFILAQPNAVIAHIIHLFKILREFNIELGMPYVRKIGQTGLRELRTKHGSDYYRIFYFAWIEQKFVLLHAIIKKTDRTPRNDIALALKRMEDYRKGY